MSAPEIESENRNMGTPITEEWLASVDFKWRQEERQPSKHWFICLDFAVPTGIIGDRFGVELACCGWTNVHGDKVGDWDKWFCWIQQRQHSIHIRHLMYQEELIKLIEGTTGTAWNPSNHLFGNIYPQAMADRLKRGLVSAT